MCTWQERPAGGANSPFSCTIMWNFILTIHFTFYSPFLFYIRYFSVQFCPFIMVFFSIHLANIWLTLTLFYIWLNSLMLVYFSFDFLLGPTEGMRRDCDPNRLRGAGCFIRRVRQSIVGFLVWFSCPISGSSTACLQTHLHLGPIHSNTTLVLLAFCCHLTGLIASKFVRVKRKRFQTALTRVCLCRKSGFVFWCISSDLVRPTVPGSSAREMLVKVPSSSSTSASMAGAFSPSTVFFWVSDDHSSMSKMSKMSHSSHYSLLFSLFLLSHSLTPAAWIIHIKVSSFPTWQVAQVTLLSW